VEELHPGAASLTISDESVGLSLQELAPMLCETEQLAKSRQLQFLAAAVDSFSAIGVEFARVINAGYAAKVESAQTDQEKWEIIAEKQRGMVLLSMAVQRRNAAIILQSAYPLGGGYASTASRTERDGDMTIE
jgi:hypothetical protein